jgi:predicted RNA-binding protein YlxR (DUF448 family)
MRTCVGCRVKDSKSELIRIVRLPGGGAGVDPMGTAPGRGAYVHRDSDCFDAATKKGALARALRTGLGPEELDRLRQQVEGAEKK